jgi:beta-N-acetylhexosaminidase
MHITADIDLGLHVLCGLVGTKLSTSEHALLKRLNPCGIILFKHNLTLTKNNWQDHLKALVAEAQNATGREQFFVSVDHEGGKVHRLLPPITHFPPAITWRETAAQVGATMGRELNALGINLNFAPVLDIWSNPENSVIGHRAFSTDSDEISRFALEFMRELEGAGVMACGKHFPGHGDTSADSHFDLPVADTDLDVLENREIAPFRSAIKAGIQMIMTAHVVYPALDPLLPATISSKIVAGYLREHLAYNNVVITDALEMGAMLSHSVDSSLHKVLMASADIALYATPQHEELPLQRAERAINTLLRELERTPGPNTTLMQNLQLSDLRVKRSLDYMEKLRTSTA